MNKRAIVFLHGYMGSSKQFISLINALNFDSATERYNIVLPGHETSLDEFTGKKRKDWQNFVDDFINKLRFNYAALILVGHSMGGLLLINHAIKFPDKIQAVYAISLPLHIKITLNGIKIRLGTLSNTTDNKYITAAKDMCGISGITVMNSYKLLANTSELIKIIKHTRKSLPALTVPLTVINSVNDEIIPMKTARLVKRICPTVTVITLNEASHFWFSEQETKIIAACIDNICKE